VSDQEDKRPASAAIDNFSIRWNKGLRSFREFVDRDRRVIDFQDARDSTRTFIAEHSASKAFARLRPELLSLASSDLGKRILKRVVVEGFADQSGTYLFNLI